MAGVAPPKAEQAAYEQGVREVDRLMRLHDITRTKMAATVGITPSMVSNILALRYKSRPFLKAAQEYLRDQGIKGGRPDGKRSRSKPAPRQPRPGAG